MIFIKQMLSYGKENINKMTNTVVIFYVGKYPNKIK